MNMNNLNGDGGGGVGVNGAGRGGQRGAAGGEAGGGGGWLFYSAAATGVAVGVGVCAGLAYAVWNTYQSSKKLKEVDQTLRFHQAHIEQDLQYKLTEVEDVLVKRQNVLCTDPNYWKLKKMDQKALLKASALEKEIPDISDTLKRILKEDKHCGSTLSYLGTGNRRQNGRLMWVEVDKWRKILENSGKP